MTTPDDQSALVTELLKALNERHSVKKNGESWRAWIRKVSTPERWFALVTMLVTTAFTSIFWMGGEWRVWRSDVAAISAIKTEVTTTVTATKEEIAKQMKEAAAVTAEARELNKKYEENVDALMEQTALLERTTRGLDQRVSRTVTRQDFNELANLVRNQIAPQLQRIEKASTSAAKFSGEK